MAILAERDSVAYIKTQVWMLVSIVDQNLADYAQADGDDILFAAADGTTKLDHEIESFDNVTGTLVAWVRIPTLSGSVDTDVYMYFGNP
ncbi:unnamed protein product, partial [marine sediment metagenome]